MGKLGYAQIKVSVFLIIAMMVDESIGHKILVVFPYATRSHGNLGDGLVRHLLKAGHQVTYITPYIKSSPQPNLTYIDVSITGKVYAEHPLSIEEVMNKKRNIEQHEIFQLLKGVTELALDSDSVINFLEDSNQSFDLVIAEWLFNEVYSGFAAVFKCPYIWVYPFEPKFQALSLIDESTNPAYTSNFELDIVPPFNFAERVRNLWFQISYKWKSYYYYDSLEKAIYERVFGPVLLKKHGSIVPYDILRYNASLMFSYSHNSLSQSITMPQNLISVGGYHVDDDPAPLPEDIKTILDNAKDGVIYFSMGSNVKSQSFPKHILQDLIKIFSEIKYTVLWKFEGDINGLSNNVRILKWAPQQSILAHPNCILFITHGGLLSATEAVHFGTPIIGIPVFYDQFSNVNRAVKHGFAKKVILDHNFAKNLQTAIADIIEDARYAAKAKELSLIYHDRPVSPGASIIHWVQHVIATQGALHLRSPGLLVPWYQKSYLDLLALVIMLLVCASWILMRFCARIRQYRVDRLRKKVA